jgi:mannose-6-phosphate isomerase-like protein (cupin superfamily)
MSLDGGHAPESLTVTRVKVRVDNAVSAGFPGPPLHHHDFDETSYVLKGELTFRFEDELFTRKEGELAFAPRGVPYTFANLSGAEARTLIICTPAGFERYFDAMAARVAGVEPPAEAKKPWPGVITVRSRIGERAPRGVSWRGS